MDGTKNFEFRRDATGKPLWHTPSPAGEPLGSEFGPCLMCGEPWPCKGGSAAAAPITITGIKLQDGATDDELLVSAEIDGEWRVVIQTRHQPGMLLSHIVEPLGMRHSKPSSR